MSHPHEKAKRSRFKDARQQPAPDGRLPNRKKKRGTPKRVMVFVKWPKLRELCLYRCDTVEQAEAWIEKSKRTYYGSTVHHAVYRIEKRT